MSLGPKQMGEAIIRNLSAKTGKSIDQWVLLLKQVQLSEKKEILAFLKEKKGLGHFQAQKVYEYFSNSDPYQNNGTFAVSIFDTKKTWELYEHVKKQLLQIASDVKLQACKTYIPFYRKKQFALLTKGKGDQIILALHLPEHDLRTAALDKATKGSARINAQIVIAKKSDFDKNISSLIQAAYQTS